MGAVDQLLLLLLQRLRRRHIGEDHELLDQLVGVKARRHDHPVHGSIGIQQDLAFGQIKIERRALGALDLQGLIGGPEGTQHGLDDRRGDVIHMAVNRRLGLGIGELGRRAHHDAVEGMAALAPLLADDHAHGERRPVHERLQGAQIVRNALGQHGHDAVGEIDGVAAIQRFPVQRAMGAHIGGDIGDGDGQHEAAFVIRIRIGLRMDRVIVILGVGGIDGDEGQIAPVFAQVHGRLAGAFGLCEGVRAEFVGDVVGVDGDEADRLLALHRAQLLAHLGLGQAEALVALQVDGDEIAIDSVAFKALGNVEFAGLALFGDGDQPPAAIGQGAEYAQHLRPRLGDELDDPAHIGGRPALWIAHGLHAQKRPIIQAGDGLAGAGLAGDPHENARGGAIFGHVPFHGLGDEVAVPVAA